LEDDRPVPNLSAGGPREEDRPVPTRSDPGPLEEERGAPIRSTAGPRDEDLIALDLSSAGPRDDDRIRAYLSGCGSLEDDRARERLSVTAGCDGITTSGLSMRGSSEKLSTQYGVAGMGSRRMMGLVCCNGGLCPRRSTGSIAACCIGLGPRYSGGLGTSPKSATSSA
jgi:hypothetical protein